MIQELRSRIDTYSHFDVQLYSTRNEQLLNSLPNDKILDQRKFKAFADDTINVTKNVKRRVENIARKEENAGYQHFLLFSQCFQKATFPGS